MNIERANRIYNSIRITSNLMLKEDLIKAAIVYARIRTDWELEGKKGRKEMDVSRTIAHDALIDSCNVLSRSMKMSGEDITWRELLGLERKR